MRRLLSITAFALFLTVPVWAQRGGGHAGGFGGARGGFAGSRGFSGGRFSGGMHSGFARSAPSSRGVHSSGFFNGTHNGFHHRFGNQFSNCFGAFCGHPGFGNRFGNPLRNCVGALCGSRFGSPWRRSNWGWGGWGWGWGWGYDPWLWSSWDYDDYKFDRDYYHDLSVAEEWNEQNLAEIRMRQQEEADREQDAYAPRSYSRRNTEARNEDQASNAASSPTVLIFRDKHQKEVTNYAIVGQTLWNFTPERKERIPLADLDIPATIKANDDRGVSFNVPRPHEGE
jgi:hypothetical protein